MAGVEHVGLFLELFALGARKFIRPQVALLSAHGFAVELGNHTNIPILIPLL